MNKIGAIFVRDARVALSYPWSIVLTLAEAAVSVIIAYFISLVAGRTTRFSFGAPGITYFDYLAINMAFVRYQSAALLGFADVIRYSLYTGTFEITLVTPTRISTLVLGSSLWTFAYTTAQVALYLGVATLFGLNLTETNLPALLIVLILTMASSVPLGVLSAALAVRFKTGGPVDFLITTATTIFGGVYIPLAALPVFMQWAGWCLPVTHALAGLRAALAGASIAQVGGEILWLAVATAALMPLALATFNFIIRRAKAKGALASF